MAGGRMKFILDTELNKTGINQLKNELQSLKNLTSQQMVDLGLSKDLNQAKKDLLDIKSSALQVEAALNKSFSSSLGTTNLSKFSKELKSLNLAQIQQNFNKAGTAGQMAFRNIATEALTTKLQLKETNTLLNEMSKTMTNTIRWGISSSIMNSFTGSVQQAWSYIKKLDKSLNDIRIVSGASAEQMEKFALQANKAAKSLGATTAQYTDASLIYYQQGLSEEQVKQRTDVTVKMANVTGESAQQVSDYMTAVWNNFAEGSENLEYYADVMAALGAATASSSEEIAAGLEKFAAVADTVGLSYEYATSALATITSETRQSADVVGTALKTIFARIQGLELGETLEDGTTLNKYSQALMNVGINIKEQNGELKNMDDILKEMGAKWETLSKDQQVALAQTVAGVRQYNQLVALMDNWDTFEQNLLTASGATGELNKQQEIYMESLDAHLKKVEASTQRVYKALVGNPDGINSLLDTFSVLVDGVSNYLESLGGSAGILLKLGNIGTKVFGKQIAQGLSTTISNLNKAKYNAKALNAELEVFKQFKGLAKDDPHFTTIVKMKEKIIELNDTLSDEQREEMNQSLERQNQLENEILLWQQKTEEAKDFYETMTGLTFNQNADPSKMENQKNNLQIESDNFANAYKKFYKSVDFTEEGAILFDKVDTERHLGVIQKVLDKATQENLDSADSLEQAYKKFNALFEGSIDTIDDEGFVYLDKIGEEALDELLKEYQKTTKEITKKTKDTLDTIDGMVAKTGDRLNNEAEENVDNFNKSLKKINLQREIEQAVDLLGHVFTLGTAISAIKSIPNIWENQNLSDGEKILQTVLAISQGLQGFMSSLSIIDGITNYFTKIKNSILGVAVAETAAVQRTTKNYEDKKEALKSNEEASKIATSVITANETQQTNAAEETRAKIAAKSNSILDYKDKSINTTAVVVVNEDRQEAEIKETNEALQERIRLLEKEAAKTKVATLKNRALSSAESKGKELYGKDFNLNENTWDEIFLNSSKTGKSDKVQIESAYRNRIKDELINASPEEKNAYKAAMPELIQEIKTPYGAAHAQVNLNGTHLSKELNELLPKPQQLDFLDGGSDFDDWYSINAGQITTTNVKNSPLDISNKVDAVVQQGQLAEALAKTSNEGDRADETIKKITNKTEDLSEVMEEAAENTGGKKGLAEGFKSAVSKGMSFIGLTPGVLGLAAAIVAGVVAWQLWQDYQEKISSDDYKISQQLTNLQEQVSATSEAYNQLKSTIDSYKDGKDALSGLTEGTVEFGQAVLEANEHALELIENLSLVAGQDYSLNANGLIEIDENKLDAALQEAQKAQFVAQGAFFATKAEYIQKSEVSGLENIYRNLAKDINSLLSVKNPEFILEGNRVSARDTEAMLNGETNSDTALQSIDKNIMTLSNNSLSTEGQLNEVIDITDLISKYSGEYTNLMAQYVNYQRMASDSYIRAYADSETLDSYTTGTSRQQQIAQDYVTKEREKEAEKNEDVVARTKNHTDLDKAGAYTNVAGMILTFGLVDLFSGGEWSDDMAEYNDQLTANNEVLEAYAENTNKWKKGDDGEYYDESGKKRSLDEIDLETAIATYRTGAYATAGASEEILGVGEKVGKHAKEQGYDTVSQSYMTEAAMALHTYGEEAKAYKLIDEDKPSAEIWNSIGSSFINAFGPTINGLTHMADTLSFGATDVNGDWNQISEGLEQKAVFDKNQSTYDFSMLTDEELDQIATLYPEYKEYIGLIKDAYSETDTQLARTQQNISYFNEELKNQAPQLETSEKALQLYAKATMGAEDALKDKNRETAKAIAQEFKFNKTYNEGVSLFDDNVDAYKEYVKAIKNGEKVSYDVAEATAAIQTSLEDLLGLEVDSDFMVENADTINKLFTGTEKEAEAAYEKLQQLALEDSFRVLGEQIGLTKTEMDDFWATFQNIQNSDTGLTFTANDSEFLTNLRSMMGQTFATQQEAQAWLDAHHIKLTQEVDGEPTLVSTKPEPTTTTTTHTISGQYNPYTGQEMTQDLTWTETVSTDTSPYWTISDKGDINVEYEKPASNFTNFKKTLDNKNKGGKGSSKKKKDPQKDELDRYQKVNSQLDKIGNTLDKLQDKRDKLTGQKLFDNLFQQFDTLNDKIDVTKDKLAIALDEMNEYKQELAKNYGIKFGEDGIIQNYKEQYYKELNALNAAIDKYSASDKDSDQEKLEKAQERYDNYNDLIKKYDDLIGSFIPDLEADIRDAIDEQIAIKIETFKYELDLKLNIKDAKLEWNEFKKTVLDSIEETDILGNTKAKLADVKVYFDDMGEGLLQTNTEKINSLLADLKNMDKELDGKIYKDDRVSAMEDLKEYYTALMDNLTEIHQLSEEIHDSYMEMMDEAQEKFDEQIEAYSTVNDLIEHDKNVITMIYGEESYSALSQFYDRQEENNNKQLDFQKQQVEFWANQMALTEEGSEEWDKAKENWMSAVSEWNSAVEAAIQNLQDKYLNAINEIFQKLNNEVTNGLGLDYVETQWDLVNRNAEEYLDSVNAIYNVQQLQSKYLDAIEQHDSASQQKKLNELMEQEMGYLREQDKLSQYDIDRANLKYEIALKQIALEEAQQNKTQLRLRRDSQGNYTYQYTQDDDQVSSIQQEIADLYNQLYNLDAEEYRGNLESLYDVWVEFQEKMAEAAQINDPEQRAAKELLIKEQYGELINTLTEKNELIQSNLNQSTMSHLFDLYNQNIENYDMMTAEQQAILSQFMTEETDFTNAAFDNLFGLYNVTVENFQGMSNAQRDILMGSIVPQWETAVQAMADKIIGEGGFFPTCAEAFIKLDEATQEYETGLITLQEVAGQSAEAIKNGLDPVIEKTQQLVKDNDELIETYNKELEAVQSVIDELDTLRQAYVDAESAAKTATEAAKNYWIAATNKDANADASKILDAEFGTEADVTKDLTKTDTNNNTSTEPAKPTLEIGSFVDVKSGALWYSNSYGGGKSGRAKDGKISYINLKGSHPYNIGGLGWIKKSDIVGYDTGGYTGDWGSDGRLAMLHQKELVLNASDTKNMLNAIEIVRDITSNLGATLMSRMAGISAASAYGGDSGILEQNVHITAEFPNVENSHEIEDALNNLINKASQYIQK